MHRVPTKYVPKVYQQLSWLSEDCENWWQVLGIWVQPRNHGSVIVVGSGSLTPKKARQMRATKLKWTFITIEELCTMKTHPTVNKHYYYNVLLHLCGTVSHKRPALWESCNWQLHHDNFSTHSSCLIQNFLPTTKFPRFTRLHTLHSCLFVISGWSQAEYGTEKVLSWENIMKNVQNSWQPYKNSTSRNVSSTGRIARLNVWSHKRCTLKQSMLEVKR